MNEHKFHILYFDTGDKWQMELTYGRKLNLLSERFRGTVLTNGDEPGFHTFGSIHVDSLPMLPSKTATTLRSLLYGWRYVRRARRNDDSVDLFISYDALRTGLIGALLSMLCRVPLIVEVNGDYTDWSNYAEIKNRLVRRLKRALYIRFATFVFRRARGIKLLYAAQIDHFRNEIPTSTLIRVFPNFLDLSSFRNLGEEKVVAIVGFPFAIKGIDIAVAAFKRIAAEYPDWSMEILGWYPGRKLRELEDCIAGHSQIRHRKQIFRHEMPEYLGRCGVVICASRTEGFPRAIKEAMQSGKPCIVSRVGGLPEAIQHDVNGLLFNKEDVNGLADQLRRLLADSELRSRLGAEGRRYAKRHFTSQAYLEHLTTFAEETTKRSRRGAS